MLSEYQTPSPIFGASILNNETISFFSLQSQLGQILMFNRYFGLQHYANLELDFGGNSMWSNIYADVTYNLDLLINTYNSDSFGSGLIVGVGAGFKISSFKLATETQSTSMSDFIAKANVGARLIFGSSYALDVIMRIPLTDTHAGYYRTTSSGDREYLKYKDYFSVAVNFTLGRF